MAKDKNILSREDLPCPVTVSIGKDNQIIDHVARINCRSKSVEIFVVDTSRNPILAPDGQDCLKVWVKTENITIYKDGAVLRHIP